MLTHTELNDLVLSDASINALAHHTRADLLNMLGMEFARMKDYDQNNPHHCYTLLEHTLRTVLAVDRSRLSDQEYLYLRIAALYHDIGKPETAMAKKDRTVFYGHAKRSAEIAGSRLRKMGYDTEACDAICFLIEYHDAFISYKKKEEMPHPTNPHIQEINKGNIQKELSTIQSKARDTYGYTPKMRDFELLLELCLADAQAQSRQVIQDGKLINTRKNKIERLTVIKEIIRGR